MFCKFCSAQIDPDAEHCYACGRRLSEQDKLLSKPEIVQDISMDYGQSNDSDDTFETVWLDDEQLRKAEKPLNQPKRNINQAATITISVCVALCFIATLVFILFYSGVVGFGKKSAELSDEHKNVNGIAVEDAKSTGFYGESNLTQGVSDSGDPLPEPNLLDKPHIVFDPTCKKIKYDLVYCDWWMNPSEPVNTDTELKFTVYVDFSVSGIIKIVCMDRSCEVYGDYFDVEIFTSYENGDYSYYVTHNIEGEVRTFDLSENYSIAESDNTLFCLLPLVSPDEWHNLLSDLGAVEYENSSWYSYDNYVYLGEEDLYHTGNSYKYLINDASGNPQSMCWIDADTGCCIREMCSDFHVVDIETGDSVVVPSFDLTDAVVVD